MTHNRQRVDKATLQQICRDHWEPFQQRYPRSRQPEVQTVIEKMLGCGEPASGYIPSLCEHGLEENRVALRCKRRVGRSCCKVDIDQWVAHSGQTLDEGVSYRPVVCTVPQALPRCFSRDRPLVADVMQCGVAMLQDAWAGVKRCVVEAGEVVVLETAGRAGHWPPHLHILMTSGGGTPEQRGLEVASFPFKGLHQKWPDDLLTMLQERVGTQEMRHQIDALWRRYRRGCVAYWENGKVPAGGEGLASSRATYVVRPPISLRRLLRYEGQRVCYG